MTLEQTVEIPSDRWVNLRFEAPHEIPTGTQVEFKIIPFPKKAETEEPPLKCLIGAKTPITDSLVGSAINEEPEELPLKCLRGIDTSLVDSLVGIIPNPDNKTYKELRDEVLMDRFKEYFE